MISTRDVIRRLVAANPGGVVSEELIRRALRTGIVAPPSTVAGRFVWQEADLPELARVLGLNNPTPAPETEASHAS